jgi:hypothetical protein
MIKHLSSVILLMMLLPVFSIAQSDSSKSASAALIRSNEEADRKAAGWAAGLKLPDSAKQKRVANAIALHLKSIRDWHNNHPFTSVPAGINPATGNKLSDLDRQIIANSSMPAFIHKDLMDVLKNELTPEQVEFILDQYTIGKVAFTLRGYKAIVPDLTSEEETKITEFLKLAREQAIDYKNMNQISAIFEIYKTKSEQYLNSNGRNWRQLYKAYVDKAKAEKEAVRK